MKNILKLIIPCLAVAFSLASCNDTMDDKASIDAQYAKTTTTTVTLNSVEAVDFQSISATGTISDVSNVIEEGIQISTVSDFSSNITSIPNDTVVTSYTIVIPKLAEQTSYYLRAYAVTKASGTLVTEAKTVSTPKAPIFPIDGDYVATEWDFNSDTEEWEAAAQYEMSITFDESDPTIVNITNLWEGGMTVQGQYDEATGQIIVPNEQVIYIHDSYGEVWIQGVNTGITAYTQYVTFQFTALGGKMESTPMGAICAAGSFGYFYVTMDHK